MGKVWGKGWVWVLLFFYIFFEIFLYFFGVKIVSSVGSLSSRPMRSTWRDQQLRRRKPVSVLAIGSTGSRTHARASRVTYDGRWMRSGSRESRHADGRELVEAPRQETAWNTGSASMGSRATSAGGPIGERRVALTVLRWLAVQ